MKKHHGNRIAFAALICISALLSGCKANTDAAENGTFQSTPADMDTFGQSMTVETQHTSDADVEPASAFSADTWEEAYLHIICNMPDYLVDVDGTRAADPELFDPEDSQVYLGVHDFDGDDAPELIVGDGLTLAVFSYADGQTQKIADLYYPGIVWCVNGVYFKGNSMSVHCNGAGGSVYVHFGFMDGQYVLGLYDELTFPSDVIINGEKSTLEEMNRIYTTNYEEITAEERREQIRLVREGGSWTLHFQSGDTAVLDDSFDYNLITW